MYAPYKREKGKPKLTDGDWRKTEFELLENHQWDAFEKIDGMNIRVIWDPDAPRVDIRGRTDRAQVPKPLINLLLEKFKPVDLFDEFGISCVTIYGEGYGGKIQKGANYSDEICFRMFDVQVGFNWLKQTDVINIAKKFSVETAPYFGRATLAQLIEAVKGGVKSTLRDGLSEGLVARPVGDFRDRLGRRIITKIKHRDLYVAPETTDGK